MRYLTLVACLFLTACVGEVGPFVDSRREAGQEQKMGYSTPDEPAICYNPLWTKEDDINTLANEVCATTQRKAQPTEKQHFKCSLLAPSIAFYKCQ